MWFLLFYFLIQYISHYWKCFFRFKEILTSVFGVPLSEYRHPKTKHTLFRHFYYLVFKWFDHVIRLTIQITYIWHHKKRFFYGFQTTIQKTGPYDNPTCLDHLNTRLDRYSDGYCILCQFNNYLAIPANCQSRTVSCVN